MLMYITAVELTEQAVLWVRHVCCSPSLHLQQYDVEISTFMSMLNCTLPMLYIVMQTPAWHCRSYDAHATLSNFIPWLRHALLWLAFCLYFLWGFHMTCFPLNEKKANEGGWLFVIAKSSAATFYLDFPLLFLVLWPGALAVTLSQIGLYIPREDAVCIHRWVGCRIVVMASVHGLAHTIWFIKEGDWWKYSSRVWAGDLQPLLPFGSGIGMWLALCLTVPAYLLWKKTNYRWFRIAKIVLSLIAVFLGLLHGDVGGLGQPTLWAFLVLLIVYFVLDRCGMASRVGSQSGQ